MNVLKECEPLYFDDYLTADMFGGRAGARSYSITQHALYELLNADFMRGFFLREIHATIYTSIWSDFKDRIAEYEEMHGIDLSSYIEYTDNKSGENYAINHRNGNTISTKGFKVSSGNQTASLKSLASATHLYIEEADEVQKSDFVKLKLSLRKKGVRLRIIRAFNPPHKSHWIWDDYTLEQVSQNEITDMIMRTSSLDRDVVMRQLKQNDKTYYKASPKKNRHISIFTNHFNNYDNLNPEAINEYDDLLQEDIHYYITTIIGLIANEDSDLVYHEYDPIENHTDKTAPVAGVLHIGMDFNIGNMSAVVHDIQGDQAFAVAEFSKVLDTQKMCESIESAYPGRKVVIYPDASGRNKSTSSKKSDHDIIRSFGFQVVSDNHNPAVRDRINVMNKQFRTRKYWVNRFQCPEYSNALQNQKYKNGEPDKTKGLDHLPDAGGYFIHKQFNKPQRVKLKVSF